MNMKQFRDQINLLDDEIVQRLAERINLSYQIAAYKEANDIPMMQPDRVAAVKARCAALGEELGLRAEFVETLYTLIIGEACQLQTHLMAGCGDASSPVNDAVRPRRHG